MENNELVHWGVKGMKWGRRKSKRTTDDNDPMPKTNKTSKKGSKTSRGRKAVIGSMAALGTIAVSALVIRKTSQIDRGIREVVSLSQELVDVVRDF